MELNCSDWVSKHKRAATYLDILVRRGVLAPSQADWLIKLDLIDEAGFVYDCDENPNAPALDVWLDIHEIPGYFKGSSRK